jgi:hypothetical protein
MTKKPTRRELIEAIDNYTTAVIDYNNLAHQEHLCSGRNLPFPYEELKRAADSKKHRREYILFFLDMLDIK